MKNTLVLLFHPNLSQSKVNRTLADALRGIDRVKVRDEYALYPDGRVEVAAEQEALTWADRIVFQFPLYWYSSPALLKEWQDKVFTYGWAYGSQGNALAGKELLVAVSTGPGGANYQPTGVVGYTITEVLRPLQATSNLIQTVFLKPFVTFGARNISEVELAQAAKSYAEQVTADREPLGAHE